MEKFYGIPMDTLSIVLLVIFGLSLGALAVSALRNKVIFKMGARNLPRRRINTALTILGLMLASMIFSASFSTGDTLTYSIRHMAANGLGQTDIVVVKEGVETDITQVTESTETKYFDRAYIEQIKEALKDEPKVEGIVPAIIETVPVIAPGSGLNEPSVDLLGLDSDYETSFDPLFDSGGGALLLEDLGENEVYINTELAESIEAGPNDVVYLYLGATATPVIIKDIYDKGGTPSDDLSMVMYLSQMQTWRGSDDINYILITNKGGAIGGAEYTDTVMGILESDDTGLEAAGLKAEPVKQDALEAADDAGSELTTMFLVFGSFSIVAGTLLIFLIFVMLAAERKRELGIARAVGTQRAHIIRMFTFEGALYALFASAIGSALGIAFGRGMIQVMDIAFEEMGFDLIYHFTTNSLLISYTLGVMLTLVIVTISAWWVGRLNIVRAIRNIPEPKRARRDIWLLIASIVLLVLGLTMLLQGLQLKLAFPYMLGGSLMIIGLPLLLRRFHMPDRGVFSLIGAGLLAFWIISFKFMPYESEMTSGMEMFTFSGVFYVGGAVLVVMYNSDLVLNTITYIFGRIKLLAPVLKTAVSYPMASRFRTGMALAMFSLIVFTLVVMAVINASFDGLLQDTDRVSGGFDIRSTVNYNTPITDIDASLDSQDGVGSDNFQTIAGLSNASIKIRQQGKEQEWEDLYLTGADSEYTSNINYGFDMLTEEYASMDKHEIWEALAADPTLTIVSAAMVPSKEGNGGMGHTPDFLIGEGDFYLEDEVLPDDVFIEVKNPFTGNGQTLHVIGVAEALAVYVSPITVSQTTMDSLAGQTVYPTVYYFSVSPGEEDNVTELATNLEKQFQKNGMDTTVVVEEIKDFTELNGMFFDLMMVFMGLGLIIGIAALGVIAARSVVERRQQIGVLRALGFQRGMVQFSFLLESSFISLLGIGIGIALGLILSIQLIPDWDVDGLEMVIPWTRIILIVGLAYGASLLTTFLPAWQASRVYPAEAIRFE